MLLNFKPQFVPFVEDGSKTHSIRALRKDGKVPRAGETCHCYTGLRRKGARLLGRWPCVKVGDFIVFKDGLRRRVFIDEVELTFDEKNALAWRDGFRPEQGQGFAFAAMSIFWDKTHRLPFDGKIIHWDFAAPRTVEQDIRLLARKLRQPMARTRKCQTGERGAHS